MNRKTMIDLINWAHHSIVSLLQWHEKNKLYYVVSLNQKWVCLNDIQQEEIDLKHLMKWAWNTQYDKKK